MKLQKAYIKGFRNFKEVEVNFANHSLMIGANDVGKTNLIYALRILLDKGFSEYDYELTESDFFIYDNTTEIVIRLYINEINEDCILAKLSGSISDNGELVLQYKSTINNSKIVHQFFLGKSDSTEDLKEIESPNYKKFLNLKYISSRREFWNYINKTKKDLLLQAKENREEDTISSDESIYADIKRQLIEIDEKVPQLSYVKNATDKLNEELNKLSVHNSEQSIVFETASSDIDKVISNVTLTSRVGDKKMLIGGEGRINQIYLSLWASQNRYTETSNEVSIICVEEPEAYLHPHQQRELALYLGQAFNGQTILTTHSPYIVTEFSPNSIIRIFKEKSNKSLVASNGCSKIIEDSFEDFGYRMSVIPAEAFFSDCAILIEGPSEMILYKTLAKQLKIDIDRLNVSILSVEGVGFENYIKILKALNIKYIIRTDNDIFKIQNSERYRYAGIERGLDFLDYTGISTEEQQIINDNKEIIHDLPSKTSIPENYIESGRKIKEVLKKYDILIAKVGLEEDLFYSSLKDKLKNHYGVTLSDEEIIEKMKKHKAINMYEFLKKEKAHLILLQDDEISLPLIRAQQYIIETYGTY